MNLIFIIIIILLLFLISNILLAESFTGSKEQDNYIHNYFNTVTDKTPRSYYEMEDYYKISLSLPPDNIISKPLDFDVWNKEAKIPSIYENRFNFIPMTTNNNAKPDTSNRLSSSKCCLVKKVFDGNDFKYIYNKYYNDDCNIDNFELDHNNQLLFEGYNGWSNEYCSNDSNILGSCQHYDFECIDFVSKETCENYNKNIPADRLNRKVVYSWLPVPCYNKNKTNIPLKSIEQIVVY
jgi:hypothetical protein